MRGRGVRVWERRLDDVGDARFRVPLRFRVVPETWPNIELAEPDGTRADIAADQYELTFRCDPGSDGTLVLHLNGFDLSLVGRDLTTNQGSILVPGSGAIDVVVVFDDESALIEIDGRELVTLRAGGPIETVATGPATDNVSGFRVQVRQPGSGWIVIGGRTQFFGGFVYGLRSLETRLYRNTRAAINAVERPFFVAGEFVVSSGHVVDNGGIPALVPDSRTIVSPIRVVEDFVWRENPYGDMTRVTDRTELWRSSVEPGRFPALSSGFSSVDAAFELALETFQRNSSGEFSLPGETGIWSAGYFQGSGLGFGSWKRDTSHVALRSGNLIDPEVARASLAHVVNAGFDNGSDGDALPAVAIWDYVLATGDESLVEDAWEKLAESALALDARFDEQRSLVRATQSTSNDLFDEPETGGYALSTEIYSMATYEALSRMGRLSPIRAGLVEHWAGRASAMKRSILAQYWNPIHGYFTSGPVGSESFERGYWETSGSEAAVWGFLGPEVDALIASVLAGARNVAMSEYGLVLFPYRDDDNHFCNSVWYCWQAGIARAAALAGDAALVHQLIAQQARTAVLNKTFYEVTDSTTGESWRWPGQLWHAAGFVSLVIFGLLGVRYGAAGLTFTPAVVAELDGTLLRGLRYRAATLDVEVRGHGTHAQMTIDGSSAERVDPDCTGHHSIVLTMTK